tara:strand:+ start:8139 stop:9068 length:930 start_codon:yes stop_codon:yes gene_type:complete
MSVYTLDIDSGERDPVSYPNPGDYVVELRHPIYDVKKLSIVSARIHASQLLVNDNNNTFSINNTNTIITLDNGNYSGRTLATELDTKLTGITVAYDKDKNDITFTGSSEFTFNFYGGTNGYNSSVAVDGKTTPHDILGLPASNVTSTNNTLTTGSVNLQGPDALIIKISNGADELNKTVYSDTPFYTGRILMCGDVVNYSGSDDAVEHNFDTGTQNISKLRIQFFYSSNNRLIPYNFRNANHILKLNIECSTDKLYTTPKVVKDFSLPPPVRIPEMEDPDRWKGYVYIFLIVFVGLAFILLTRPKKISE